MKTLLLLALAACGPTLVREESQPKWISDTSTIVPGAPGTGAIAREYRATADKIIAAARADRGAFEKLAHLTDRIGHRLAGSPELDKAIAWAAQAMKDDGLAVHTEKVMVPHWVRGTEDAQMIAPVARPIAVLGLGGSVSTPRDGITATVVVIRDWAELEAKAAQVKGAIVLFDVAMPAWTEEKGSGYGEVSRFRVLGPSRAAKLGAAAVLMRSVTARSLHTLHTGTLVYDPAQPKVPAAAVTVEDSLLIARLTAQGPVTIKLRLESQSLPEAESANVIGELRGREKPDEIVVIGGHIDSWDVGQGAHDDGAGCVMMMEALRVLKQLGLAPRRTIRVVLFTNEENGVRGSKGYALDHAAELPKTVMALESDSGGFAPRGFDVVGKPEVVERVTDIASLLRGIAPMTVKPGYSGTDIEPMQGVPQIGLRVDNRTYFDIHHTDADTLDKVDPAQLADDVAAVAVLAYVTADVPDRLDAPSR